MFLDLDETGAVCAWTDVQTKQVQAGVFIFG
jgi:hypothetical protein